MSTPGEQGRATGEQRGPDPDLRKKKPSDTFYARHPVIFVLLCLFATALTTWPRLR